jgi:hypothetical protein
MATFYRSRHELIFAFKKGSAPHVSSFELGQHGRYRTNVWEYRGANTRRTDRLQELSLHPTVKPTQLIAGAKTSRDEGRLCSTSSAGADLP